MAKRRRQTTGQPRRRSAPAAAAEDGGREYVSRAARESRIQRWVLIGTGVTIALVVLILLGAIVVELLVTPNSTAARVADESISISAFQERVRLERAILNTRINSYVSLLTASGLDINQFAGQEPLRGWLAQVQNPDQLGSTVLDIMIEDIIVRQEAAALGLSVGQEQINDQIDEFIGLEPPSPASEAEAAPLPTAVPVATRTPFVSPTPRTQATATLTPEFVEPTATATLVVETTPTYTSVPATATPTIEDIEEQQADVREQILGDLASSARISMERLNAFFEALALREALAAEHDELMDTLPHINARHILVAEEETAADLLAALAEGESFAALAIANSLDTASGQNGGELGWAPVSSYVRPFAEAALAAEPGATVGPVQSEFGWHIIQVRAMEERTVSETQLESARNTAFRNWLDDQRAAQEELIEINPIWAENVPDDPILLLTGPA